VLTNILITKWKIRIARTFYFFIKIIIRKDELIIKRNGIRFYVNLEEGIDLHLFLFGNFQKHIYSNPLINLSKKAIIFDVGANIGAMSLVFAQKVPNGQVYSFEPTDFAYSKMQKNLKLNPDLASKISLEQTFIYSNSTNKHELKAYSSWKLTKGGHKHPIHRGIAKPTNNIPTITIDDYCEKNHINRLDFIKIDTDGYEYEILKGALKTLTKLKPKIIFEIGIYIMDEKNLIFKDYINYFEGLGYEIRTIKGKQVCNGNFKKHIPLNGTVDLFAIPKS